ncbi:uncharacterized protein LOC129568682 isoform X2 [Sitodiplosis mosellana]|uniref:uncharacterized protein LOC129568682 isoform X2 n=1 Tax=Sitodiplosis mosellana TaxID=263140 RepID=UPI002443D68D|nr:uncharacterized protein LOC129568682 isoform X2 [Sitodiplosis mosellana]
MRLIHLFVGIIIFTIFIIYWFVVLSIDVFQYRAMRVGYKRFYQLMDSLFNEFRSEENDEMEEVFESHIDDYDEDNNIQKLMCYTWSSLNDLIRINNNRLIDASKRVRDSPTILKDRLEKDLQITNAIVYSYNIRLNLALPPFLSLYQNQLSEMLATTNDINKAFQYFIGDAIRKIDHDQYESYQSSSIRVAKILQQFKSVIQSQNEAHLECACDTAKHLDALIQDFAERLYLCVNATSEQFSNYIKETITPMANSMETTIRSVTRGMKRSKTSVEVFYQLPMKVLGQLKFHDKSIACSTEIEDIRRY